MPSCCCFSGRLCGCCCLVCKFESNFRLKFGVLGGVKGHCFNLRKKTYSSLFFSNSPFSIILIVELLFIYLSVKFDKLNASLFEKKGPNLEKIQKIGREKQIGAG